MTRRLMRDYVAALMGMLLLVLITIAANLRAAPRLSASTTQPALPRSESASHVQFEQDIVYGNAGGEQLKLDLARPAASGRPLPCLIFIHGGGWAMGSKSVYDDAARIVASNGYVAATVEYRFAPTYRFPAQVQDVKCAVRFLRANAARYGIDPNRIGAIGDSAGGHLVMMLGVTRASDDLEGDGGSPGVSSAVQAVVSWFGPTDFTAADVPEISKPILQGFFGDHVGDPATRRKASPISYVHADEPPMLLMQGTLDPLVPPVQAERMSAAMTKANAPGRVELLIGAGHGFNGADRQHAIDAAANFFEQHLHPGK